MNLNQVPLAEEEVEQTFEDVQLALEDIDSDDADALYERCEQILDDIHAGRF